MSRIARIVLAGIPYHITQRGNRRQQIFFEDADYHLYLDLLSRYSREAGLVLSAYCLMPNHVHIIATPQHCTSMAQALGKTHADFARYYNLKMRTCGHVWQARYYSTPLDATHLWQAMAYVERNPVRARLAAQAEEYSWSSALLRLKGADAGVLIDLASWQAEYDWERWKEVLATSIDEEAFGRRLQEASRRGRPLGDEQFIEDLEQRCARRLRALPVGRPKSSDKEEKDQLLFGFGV